MPLETFRSRETIKAVYYDGSIESALEVARLFTSRLQIEFTGADGSFLLRAVNQAAFLQAHTWVYENGSGRVEWRDQEELTRRWERVGAQAEPPKKKGKGK